MFSYRSNAGGARPRCGCRFSCGCGRFVHLHPNHCCAREQSDTQDLSLLLVDPLPREAAHVCFDDLATDPFIRNGSEMNPICVEMHENSTPFLHDQGDNIESLLHLAVTQAGLLIKTLDQELHLIGAEACHLALRLTSPTAGEESLAQTFYHTCRVHLCNRIAQELPCDIVPEAEPKISAVVQCARDCHIERLRNALLNRLETGAGGRTNPILRLSDHAGDGGGAGGVGGVHEESTRKSFVVQRASATREIRPHSTMANHHIPLL